MNKFILLIQVSILLLVNNSWGQSNIKHSKEERYPSGKIKSQYTDGINSNGDVFIDFKSYFEEGGINTYDHTLVDNNNNTKREYKIFYKNGQLRLMYFTFNGKKNGQEKEYYENGKIQGITFYKDGKKSGERKTYYNSGQLKSFYNYEDDLIDGEAKEYFMNGKLSSTCIYKKGQMHGVLTAFDEKGQITLIREFQNGSLIGDKSIEKISVNKKSSNMNNASSNKSQAKDVSTNSDNSKLQYKPPPDTAYTTTPKSSDGDSFGISKNISNSNEGGTINSSVTITTSSNFEDKSKENLVPQNKVEDEKIYSKVEVEASFPGGYAEWKGFLKKNLNKNIPVKKGAPEGTYTVITRFKVDKEGNLSQIETDTHNGYGMEEEAIRVLKTSGKWVPAQQNGKNVSSFHRQAIIFEVE